MRYCVLVLTMAVLTGCAFKGGSAGDTSAPSREMGSRWVARATSIRVYPAPRFVRRDNAMALEARIELFDEMGDSIKSSGNFQLELREIGSTGEEGALLYRWQVELHTVEHQRQYFDPVTHTYLFYLKMDGLDGIDRTTRFNAVCTLPDGKRHLALPVDIHP